MASENTYVRAHCRTSCKLKEILKEGRGCAVHGKMVHVCVIPGCSNRSDRDTQLSYHCLPLRNKALLRVWIHKIDRKRLPVNRKSRVCSEHFVSAAGRVLRPEKYHNLLLESNLLVIGGPQTATISYCKLTLREW